MVVWRYTKHMIRNADTRRQMIETAVRSFQRQGYSATSWRSLVDEAGTPWGSVHHHFPEGKEQLGLAGIELGKLAILAELEQTFVGAKGGPAAAVRAWCRARAHDLETSDFQNGCPITTVALETASTVPAVAGACRDAFGEWEALLTRVYIAAGIKPKRAAELAVFTVASVEGAVLLSRISRSQTPLRVAGDLLASLITDAATKS